ncbi:hypothetical protein [uncultured Pedobacter sp.]|nr:hypothetical protein [uncultured Pedobacter sp.]
MAAIRSEINPTGSVIGAFSGGLSQGRGWSNRSTTGIAFLMMEKVLFY